MEEGTVKLSPYEIALKNQQIMWQIVQEMREEPLPPSELPKDVAALQRVEFPVNGGIHTYMEGHDFPYRGFPYYEFVDKVDTLKKVSRSVLSGLYHGLKGKNRLLLLTLIPSSWFFKYLVRSVIYAFHRIVYRFKVKQKLYSQSMRELHRAFSIDRDRERIQTIELRRQLRDILCMVLEYDNAYRFRFQDIVEELNKEDFKKNPAKEIVRLFSIMQTREKGQDVSNTWVLLKLFTHLYLKFDKEMRGILIDVVNALNIEEITLSDEDKHYCRPRSDYTFAFHVKEKNV